MPLNQGAPNVEDFLCCWLQPVIRAAVERDFGDSWPFVVVARVSGADCPASGTDDAVVQLDILAPGVVDASAAADLAHRQMALLEMELPQVTMSDGSTAEADYSETLIKPTRMTFADDTVVRYVARYQVGLHYVAVS